MQHADQIEQTFLKQCVYRFPVPGRIVQKSSESEHRLLLLEMGVLKNCTNLLRKPGAIVLPVVRRSLFVVVVRGVAEDVVAQRQRGPFCTGPVVEYKPGERFQGTIRRFALENDLRGYSNNVATLERTSPIISGGAFSANFAPRDSRSSTRG